MNLRILALARLHRKNEAEESLPSPSREESEVSFSELSDGTITRARAIKLVGATLAGGALAVLWPDEADARRRRRRRRRRRKRATTANPSTVNFGDTLVNTLSPPAAVTITNNGTTSVTLSPEVVGEGFTLVDASDLTLDAGESKIVYVVFAPDVSGNSTGELRLVDASDGLVVVKVELLGNGVTV